MKTIASFLIVDRSHPAMSFGYHSWMFVFLFKCFDVHKGIVYLFSKYIKLLSNGYMAICLLRYFSAKAPPYCILSDRKRKREREHGFLLDIGCSVCVYILFASIYSVWRCECLTFTSYLILYTTYSEMYFVIFWIRFFIVNIFGKHLQPLLHCAVDQCFVNE